MGACNFDHQISAYSAKEGFDSLVREANYEYGHESYNGTISTCCLGGCTLKFEKYSETNRKKAYDFIEKKDWGRKWESDYIDLGVKEYHVLTVKKRKVEKATPPTYKLKFVVKPKYDDSDYPQRYQSFLTKTEAAEFAVKQTLKTAKPYVVHKEYVLEKGNKTVTETYIEKKVYKSKPKLKPMANRRIVELHEYIFYGWAAC